MSRQVDGLQDNAAAEINLLPGRKPDVNVCREGDVVGELPCVGRRQRRKGRDLCYQVPVAACVGGDVVKKALFRRVCHHLRAAGYTTQRLIAAHVVPVTVRVEDEPRVGQVQAGRRQRRADHRSRRRAYAGINDRRLWCLDEIGHDLTTRRERAGNPPHPVQLLYGFVF